MLTGRKTLCWGCFLGYGDNYEAFKQNQMPKTFCMFLRAPTASEEDVSLQITEKPITCLNS